MNTETALEKPAKTPEKIIATRTSVSPAATTATTIDAQTPGPFARAQAISESTPTPEKKPLVIKIITLDGKEFNTEKMRGTPVIINFWASWCFPCRLEAETLENTYKKYKPRGVQFIGIATQDTEQNARDFIKEFKVTYPNAVDKDTVAMDNSVFILPMTIVLDKNGREVIRVPGVITAEYLAWAIEGILKDKKSGKTQPKQQPKK